jgi:PAS domain S-box-containing protein
MAVKDPNCWTMSSDKHHRVVVVAPTGRDAQLLCEMLGRNGIVCEPYGDIRQLCEGLRDGAGAILLAEEALGPGALENLSGALSTQPEWSDLPLIVLTSDWPKMETSAGRMFRQKGARGNLVILEKPIRPLSLCSTVGAALMTRARQYELRDYLDQRSRAEASLRESEERFRLLVEGVKDYAIYMLDVDGKITSWNQGAQQIKGYRAEEIIGEHVSRFYPPEDVAQGKPELQLKEAEEEGRCETLGWRIRKDGTRFFADVVITALKDEAGHLRGFSKITRDITERKRSEEALLGYQQELQGLTSKLIAAQEMESKRLARELHDAFSQKLAVLGLKTAALAQRPPESFAMLRGSLIQLTEQIGRLSNDIHQISRQLHPAILDDLGLEAALKNECLAFSDQHGIATHFDSVDVPKNIPDDVSLCLYRVSQECLRNVAKHSHAVSVRFTLSTVGAEIVMEIADAGDGFDLKNIKGKRGLGLISMDERVRLVNGTLSVVSQPGRGTVVNVRVRLPQ